MTHGSHWECIVEDIEVFFQDEFEELMKDSVVIDEINEFGFNLETKKEQNNTIHSLLYPSDDYPVKILTLLVNKQLWSSYPIINYGMSYEVIIEDIIEEGNLIEGQISCRLKDNPDFLFSFFDPMFYRNKSKYKIGNTYFFIFNGFMYSCNKNNYEGMNLTTPQKKSGIFNIFNSKEKRNKEDIYLDKNSVVFLSNNDGDIDDYKIISPILNVEKFENIYEKTIYKLEVLLLNGEDKPFNIPVIVSEQNLKDNFIPIEGESLNGSIWLCGILNDTVIESIDKIHTKVKLDVIFNDRDYPNLYQGDFTVEFDFGYDITDIDLESFFQEYRGCLEFNTPLPEFEILFEQEIKKQIDKEFFDNRDYVEVQTHLRDIYFPNKTGDYLSLEEKFDEEGYEVLYEEIKDSMGNCQFIFDNHFLEEIEEDKGLFEEVPLSDSEKVNIQEIRKQTFEYQDNQEHYMGSHWDSFYEEGEFDNIIGKVLSVLNKSMLLEGYKKEELSFGYDSSWEIGFTQLVPSNNQQGFCVVQKVDKENEEINVMSMFPYFDYGQKYELNLEKVFVWSNGLEGQVEVDLGFTTLTFYDTYFNNHKEYYLVDKKYKFKIFGICYECGIPTENELKVDMKPEVLESIGKDPKDTLQTFNLKGMTSFFPILEWDRDDFSFRGVIEEVFEVETVFGRKGWICRTKVLRSGFEEDNEYSIDILVTDLIWKTIVPPQVGDDIEGSVWLQGRMIEPLFEDTK